MAQTDPIIPDPNASEHPRPRVLGVIPARLASTRLPRKVLRQIAGQPMLAWVYNAALACPELDAIVIATDSEEVARLCRERDWPHRLTSPDLPSGSDRVEAIAREIPADIYVNIQGDEPLVRPEHLSALLRPFRQPHARNPDLRSRLGSPGPNTRSNSDGRPIANPVEVTTLRVACTPENIHNPNAVKVVTAPDGRALYFSRAPIPYHRDLGPLTNACHPPQYWKHIGLYAYTAAALHRFTTLPPSPLEQAERLEQLRFLENNIPIHVETTPHDTIGVDTEADLQAVELLLAGQLRDQAR